jgi:hypothetical protein
LVIWLCPVDGGIDEGKGGMVGEGEGGVGGKEEVGLGEDVVGDVF